MTARLLLTLGLLCLGLGFSARASEAGFLDIFGGELQVSGGMTDWMKDKGAVIVRNYATVVITGRTIRARNIILYWQTKQLYAEGDVSVEDPAGRSFYCDRLYWNWAEWNGQIENLHIKIHDPDMVAEPPTESHITDESPRLGGRGESFSPNFKAMNVYATNGRALDKEHYEATGVTLTPSMFAKPHWSIQTGAINVRKDKKIESWHNILKIGPVPVMYIPYIIKDLKYDWPWMQFAAGKDDDWGYWVHTKWGFDLNPSEEQWFRLRKIFLTSDYYQERGLGAGLDFEYEPGRGESVGFINSYYIKETGISDDDDEDRAEHDVAFAKEYYGNYPGYEDSLYQDEDRYALDWWHRQQFNERFDLRLEAHKAGDRDFVREYFQNKYDTQKEDENSADLRYLADKWELELVGSDPANDWQSQSSYMPELRFNLPGVRAGELPVFVKNESTMGIVRRQYDERIRELGLRDSYKQRAAADKDKTPSFLRAHQDTRAYVPIKMGDWTLQPYAGARTTYYDKTYGENRNAKGDSEWNAAALYGADLSTRVFGFFKEDTFRHMVEPTFSYIANEKPSVDKDRLFDIDYIDNYEKAHFLKFNLHQALQQKKNKGIRDLIDFDIEFSYIPDDEEAESLNNGRHFTDIKLDLVVRPTENLVNTAYVGFNPDDGGIRDAELTTSYTFAKRFRIYAKHAYRKGETTDDYRTDDSNLSTIALRSQLWDENSHWSIEYAVSYEHEDSSDGYLSSTGYRTGGVEGGLNEQKITLYRNLDTVELGFSYIRDERDDDQGFMVELKAKGWQSDSRGPVKGQTSSTDVDDSRYGRPSATDEAPAYQP